MAERKRALIIGCGRMGAGRDHVSPWVYTHPEAYLAMDPARVQIVGFVDRVLARAESAAQRWKVDFFGDHVTAAIKALQPDIVSVCTPPSDRYEIMKACDGSDSIRGIWCEKPYTLDWVPFDSAGRPMDVQVDYIRRFDRRHQAIRDRRFQPDAPTASLFVISANDIHTTSHFTDLAVYWKIDHDRLHYVPFHGPSLYILREPGIQPGRYSGWRDEAFVGGGVETGFMEAALSNLLDAVDGKAELISPANDTLFAAERWADQIVAGQCNVR